jgi:putative flippase GtrA
MNHLHRQKAAQKPATLRPIRPWLAWGWHGLFVKGHTSNQFLRFCLVGASGVVVNYLVMRGLYNGLRLPYGLCSVTAYLVASVNNFIFNKIFTFRDEVRGLWPIVKQYLRFLSVILLGMAINLGALVALVELMHMDPVPANLLGVLLATVSNFLGNKLFAFRQR